MRPLQLQVGRLVAFYWNGVADDAKAREIVRVIDDETLELDVTADAELFGRVIEVPVKVVCKRAIGISRPPMTWDLIA